MPTVNSGDTLQAQWYNTLTASLGLSPQRFQLLQPAAPLGTTSNPLWAYFNDLPADTIATASLSGGDQFYSNYAAVVRQLIPQDGGKFQAALGDSYDAWMTFISDKTNLPVAPQTMIDVFSSWADIYAPDVAAAGADALLDTKNDTISMAKQAVSNPPGFTPTFSRTIGDLKAALQSAPSASFSFDSGTASSDISSTWSAHSSGFFFGFFADGASGSSESTLSTTAASSQFIVSATFAHVMTFQADPGSWYSSAALGAAYSQPDNTVWSHGTPSWMTTFGPDGNMLHFTASIVVVDGVDMTIQSIASYSKEDQDHYRSQSSGGFWPFYSSSSTYTSDKDVTFDSDGSLTVHVSSPAGNPLVFGINAVPARQYILGQAAAANAVAAAAPIRRAA